MRIVLIGVASAALVDSFDVVDGPDAVDVVKDVDVVDDVDDVDDDLNFKIVMETLIHFLNNRVILSVIEPIIRHQYSIQIYHEVKGVMGNHTFSRGNSTR